MSTISGLSSTTTPYPSTNPNNLGQSIKDFNAIGTALQAGNLAAAQTALTSFQQGLQSDSPASTGKLFGNNSPANKDYQNLTSAIKTGDTAAAQKAFASLKADIKTPHKGHHHSAAPAAATALSNGPTGNIVNTTA